MKLYLPLLLLICVIIGIVKVQGRTRIEENKISVESEEWRSTITPIYDE